MDERHRNIIARQEADLVDNISMPGLCSHLMSKGVLSPRQKSSIMAGKTNYDQVEKLLEVLPKCGSMAFEHFCDALIENGQDFVVDKYLKPGESYRPSEGHSPMQASVSTSDSTRVADPYASHPSMYAQAEEDRVGSYDIDSNTPGAAFILNNVKFTAHPERFGSHKDVENMKALFTSISFPYEEVTNCDKQETLDIVKEWSKSELLRYCSSCIVVLMSHGREGHLISTDNQLISIAELISYFNGKNCPALVGKPKMFVVQACRGTIVDQGVGADHMDCTAVSAPPTSISSMPTAGTYEADVNVFQKIPVEQDFVIAYSTSPGYVSMRNSEMGTWYIDNFCDVFRKNVDRVHVVDMLTMVNRKVAAHYSTTIQAKMVPQPAFSLTKNWYLRGRLY